MKSITCMYNVWLVATILLCFSGTLSLAQRQEEISNQLTDSEKNSDSILGDTTLPTHKSITITRIMQQSLSRRQPTSKDASSEIKILDTNIGVVIGVIGVVFLMLLLVLSKTGRYCAVICSCCSTDKEQEQEKDIESSNSPDNVVVNYDLWEGDSSIKTLSGFLCAIARKNNSNKKLFDFRTATYYRQSLRRFQKGKNMADNTLPSYNEATKPTTCDDLPSYGELVQSSSATTDNS